MTKKKIKLIGQINNQKIKDEKIKIKDIHQLNRQQKITKPQNNRSQNKKELPPE